MKKAKIIFWISTGFIFLFEGVMPALTGNSELAVQGITHLGYPLYFVTILRVFKVLGALTLIIPQAPVRIKEWAYAGLAYDLFGALYSIICNKAVFTDWVFMLLPISLGALSYIFYHKKLKYDLSSIHQ